MITKYDADLLRPRSNCERRAGRSGNITASLSPLHRWEKGCICNNKQMLPPFRRSHLTLRAITIWGANSVREVVIVADDVWSSPVRRVKFLPRSCCSLSMLCRFAFRRFLLCCTHSRGFADVPLRYIIPSSTIVHIALPCS